MYNIYPAGGVLKYGGGGRFFSCLSGGGYVFFLASRGWVMFFFYLHFGRTTRKNRRLLAILNVDELGGYVFFAGFGGGGVMFFLPLPRGVRFFSGSKLHFQDSRPDKYCTLPNTKLLIFPFFLLFSGIFQQFCIFSEIFYLGVHIFWRGSNIFLIWGGQFFLSNLG